MPLYKAHFTFINGLTQGRKVKINMKITTRKASTLAIALAIPATSFAGASAAFAADDASTKEVTVDVNLGSDAAESDVTLLAGDEEVGTETADEDGKVSFSYDAEGAETLKVEVGGDTVTLTDAKCTGVKESTENSSEDTTGDNTSSGDTASGTDTDVTDNSGSTAGKTSTAPTASTPGSTSTAPTSSDSEKPSASDSEKPSASESTDASASDSAKPSDSKKPSTSGSEKPSASASDSAKPSDEKPSGNTDGSATNVAEALKDIEKNTDKNVATNKEVHGDVKDAKKLSAELKKLEKAEGIDKSKVEKTVNGLNDVIKKQKDGKVTVPAELQAGATDLLKTAVGVLAPQYSGIANTAIDAASGLLGGGSGDGGSIIDAAKGALGLGGSDSGSDATGSDVSGGDTAGTDVPAGDTGVAPDTAGDVNVPQPDNADTPSTDTGAAVSTPDTAEDTSTPDTAEDTSTPDTAEDTSTPDTEEVELNSSVDDMSFTVDLEEGVASVDCDVDTEAAETDDEDEVTSETSTTPSETPTSAAPAAAPSVSTPGPKVNTGGEVEGTSFFAKVKALF